MLCGGRWRWWEPLAVHTKAGRNSGQTDFTRFLAPQFFHNSRRRPKQQLPINTTHSPHHQYQLFPQLILPHYTPPNAYALVNSCRDALARNDRALMSSGSPKTVTNSLGIVLPAKIAATIADHEKSAERNNVIAMKTSSQKSKHQKK